MENPPIVCYILIRVKYILMTLRKCTLYLDINLESYSIN